MIRINVLSILFFALPLLVSSQTDELVMTDGETVTTCQNTFYDPGGFDAYTGNTTITYTICPDNPGDAIQVDFIIFDLQQNAVNPNNSHYLTIYQGDAATGTPASYTGSQLQGLSFAGNTSNLTGCLTFVFQAPTANNSEAGGWAAQVTCVTPCDPPTQMGDYQSHLPPVPGLDSISVCIGDEVTFTGENSFAAPGFTLDQYIWDFDDGEELDTLSGMVASHVFDVAGEFLINHAVRDDNGCYSVNIAPLKVIVSTLPDVVIDYPEESCIGETFDISASVEGVTWTSLPPISVGGETYLADAGGFEFESTLVFDFFEPDQELEECDDLIDVFLNIEHSYLGDLEMYMECPDGTQVFILDFPNGGGGTFLGEPIDPGPGPGVGYDYSWNMSSTNGYMDDAANEGANNAVIPQDYLPEGDFCDFVGCPLNGTWTFIITDNLAIDDGNIFEWGMNLNPELFPGVTTFTPMWGEQADSSSWGGGQFITQVSPDGNTITVEPTEPGEYDYTFTTENNFGCSFDTTVTVTVLEPLSPNAGADAEINCEEPYQLNVFLETTPEDNCEYELILFDTGVNGWAGGELEVVVNGVSSTYTMTTTDGVTVNVPFTVDHEASLEIYYTPGDDTDVTQDPSQNEYILLDANGDVLFTDGEFGGTPTAGLAYSTTAYCFPPEPNLSYNWSPSENLNSAGLQNPTVSGLVETTTFTVEVWQPNHPDCKFTDEVTLTVSGALDAGVDLANCGMTYQLDGTDIPNGEWSAAPGVDVTFQNPTQHNTLVTAGTPGVYELTWTDLDGLTCPTSSSIEVSFFDGIDITATVTDPFCYGQCNGEILLTGANGNVNPPLADYAYFLSGNTSAGAVPNEFEDLCYGYYTVTLKDNDSCATSVEVFVNQPPEPIIDSIVTVRESCLGFCDGEVHVFSGQAANYSFDGGTSFQATSSNTSLCGGFYDVVIADANGCQSAGEAIVPSPTPPEALFAADPVRTGIFDPFIQFTNFSDNYVSLEWTFGLENYVGSSIDDNPYFQFPTVPGIYTVQLVVTDSIGCTDSTQVDIEIMDEMQIFVPTAFSPNDDGINDIFRIEIQDLSQLDYSFQVFDRWGNMVYQTSEYPTQWNGQGPDEEQYYVPDGVYIWQVKARSASTTDRVEKMGMVTVIR
jgi:gliding motility-associated-like protein